MNLRIFPIMCNKHTSCFIRTAGFTGGGQPSAKAHVIDTGDGILLKPSRPFKNTEIDQVAGILKYSGKPVSIDQMKEAIKKGALERK